MHWQRAPTEFKGSFVASRVDDELASRLGNYRGKKKKHQKREKEEQTGKRKKVKNAHVYARQYPQQWDLRDARRVWVASGVFPASSTT